MPRDRQSSPLPVTKNPRLVAVLVLGLALYSEDPDGMGDAINVFMFTDLSLSAVLEAALLERRWYAVLGGGVALTSFADTSLLLSKQRVESVTIWEAADKKLEA